MSKLSERVEERKAEAQALADKFNAAKANIDKLQEENAQVYEEFKMKNYPFTYCCITRIYYKNRNIRN